MPQTVPSPPVTFSLWILLALILAFGLSLTMFILLVRRWTSHRQWVSLAEWARERGYRLRPFADGELPEVLNLIGAQGRFLLVGPKTRIAQLQKTTVSDEPDAEPQIVRYNLLVRDLGHPWPPAAARPAPAPHSLIDTLELREFPTLSSDRFTMKSIDLASAHRLADSAARGLLPPDVGLLMHGQHLILDFSQRPFDPTEFGRMISLADQLQTL